LCCIAVVLFASSKIVEEILAVRLVVVEIHHCVVVLCIVAESVGLSSVPEVGIVPSSFARGELVVGSLALADGIGRSHGDTVIILVLINLGVVLTVVSVLVRVEVETMCFYVLISRWQDGIVDQLVEVRFAASVVGVGRQVDGLAQRSRQAIGVLHILPLLVVVARLNRSVEGFARSLVKEVNVGSWVCCHEGLAMKYDWVFFIAIPPSSFVRSSKVLITPVVTVVDVVVLVVAEVQVRVVGSIMAINYVGRVHPIHAQAKVVSNLLC